MLSIYIYTLKKRYQWSILEIATKIKNTYTFQLRNPTPGSLSNRNKSAGAKGYEFRLLMQNHLGKKKEVKKMSNHRKLYSDSIELEFSPVDLQQLPE